MNERKKIFFHYIIFIIILILFSFLFHQSHKLSYLNLKANQCNKLKFDEAKNIHPSNFQTVKFNLEINDKKKWAKINIKDSIEAIKKNQFTNRKRVNGTLIVNINNNFSCILNVSIRSHGDQKDHREGKGLPSLQVKVLEGHLFGIVEFLLIKPKARYYDNEIFATSLFQEINLAAPRTSSVELEYSGFKQKYIFQEKLVKEFLENLNFKEGPIYEGDERFAFLEGYHENNRFMGHKLANNKWAMLSQSNQEISEFGLSLLNKYASNLKMDIPHNWVVDYSTLSNKFKETNYFSKLQVFDAMMFSLDAIGNLSLEDRRFYYDSLERKFIPIFYDGVPTLFNKFNQLKMPELVNINNLEYDPPKFEYAIPNLLRGKVTQSAIDGALEAIKLLDGISSEDLTRKLNLRGMKISQKDVDNALLIIKKKLSIMSDFSKDRRYEIFLEENFKLEASNNYLDQFKRKIVYITSKIDDEYNICNIYGNNCEIKKFTKQEFSKILNQNYKDDKNYELIYLGKIKGDQLSRWYYNFNEKVNSYNQLVITNQKFKILKNNGVVVDLDEVNKIINITKKEKNGRVVFKNGILDGWIINFINFTKEEATHSDNRGLTGCLNFYDLIIEKTKINIENSNCEDAINLVRVKGTIDSISINNSLLDALDSDFSEINVKNLSVVNAGNDCLDFSYGKIYLKVIDLSICGDKGISVGEKTILRFDRTDIKNTNIGIASKDFSEIYGKKASIEDTKTCLAAYKKKQEFSGGYIKIDKLDCINSIRNIDNDSNSKILVNH